MKIYFIRHAETQANLDASKPTTLTAKGEEQVKKLAEYLKDESFDAIYSSDLERAQKTAQAISEDIIITDELREMFRVIIGGPKKESRPNRKQEDEQRAEQFFQKILAWNYNKVAIVAHGNIIRYFLARIQNKDVKTMWEEEIIPCSINIIEHNKITYVTKHLKGIETKETNFVE